MPTKPQKRTDAEILRDLLTVEIQSEPENVYMDGEASMVQGRSTLKKLAARRKKLVTELGRTPSDMEIFSIGR